MNGSASSQYSLDTLYGIASFWPSRVALAFVASQPRCRIAAEACAAVASSELQHRKRQHADYCTRRDVDTEVQTAWTTWAAQLPFGEWWVSHITQGPVPSDEACFREMPFIEERDNAVSAVGRQQKAALRGSTPSPPSPPLPPSSTVLPATACALDYISAHHVRYRAYRERRSATTAQFQSGVLDIAAEAAPSDSADVLWPDCPYPGERLWCLSVRSGYAGGVRAGCLVSFLVPVSHRRSADVTGDSHAADGADGCSAGPGPSFRRILHWDVRADELRRERETCRRQRSSSGQEFVAEGEAAAEAMDIGNAHRTAAPFPRPAGSSHADLPPEPSYLCTLRPMPSGEGSSDAHVQAACAAAAALSGAIQRDSWSYSYWWFCRPLCLSRVSWHSVSSGATPSPTACFTHACGAQGVAEASIYVYGSHPASLLSHLKVGCSASASLSSCPNASCSCSATAPLAQPSSSLSACQLCKEDSSFVTALHLYDCATPSPAATDPAETSSLPCPASPFADRLRSWCDALRSSGCCERLSRLEIDFEGCLDALGEASEPLHSTGTVGNTVSPFVEGSVDAAASRLQGPSRGYDIVGVPAAHAFSSFFSAAVPSSVHVCVPQLNFLTEVRLSESNLSDVNFLGELLHLRLADVTMNRRLTDRGVEGVARSTSLCVLNLSFCTLVDKAAVALAAIATLEELYLTGTALTDSTLRFIARQQHEQHHRSLESDTAAVPTPASRLLRVLHVDACRHLQNPVEAFTACRTLELSPLREREAWWKGLLDVCASAAPRRRRHTSRVAEHDEGAEGDALPREEDGAAEALMESPQEQASEAAQDGDGSLEADLLFSPMQDGARQRALVSSSKLLTAAPLSVIGMWPALTTLELQNVALHCPLGELGVLPNLQRLSLQRCSEAGAWGRRPSHRRPPWLAGLERCLLLRSVLLEASDAAFTDEGSMRVLAQLPSLQDLTLRYARVRDAAVEAFVQTLERRGEQQHLPCPLRRLSLGVCSRLTQMSAIARLTSVRVLDVSDTSVQQDFVHLLGTCATHHALQVLKMAACAEITSANPLAALRELRQLDLSHTLVTTAGVAELRNCRALTHLSLKGCAGVTHVRDVMSIPTLQVLNVQGSGLYEEPVIAGCGVGSSGWATPGQVALAPPLCGNEDCGAVYADLFPLEDGLLRRSVLSTLLLSCTRVCRIRRLGLLPWLMCLDIGATRVTDAELAMFVCTGMQQVRPPLHRVMRERADACKDGATQRRSKDSAKPPVMHSLRHLCQLGEALMSSHLGHDGPLLRVLSLQRCRSIFTVGVLGLCPHLTKLDLSFSNVTSRGLIGLHRTQSLVQLRLVGCKGVHDMRVLGRIATLREVDGSGCNVRGDRVIGSADDAAGDAADLSGETGAVKMPTSHALALHSDLFQAISSPSVGTVGLRRLIEGVEGDAVAVFAVHEHPSFAPAPSTLPISHVCAPRLSRLTLDGCVNIRGSLAALGCLPALLDLSLRNCNGITAVSLEGPAGGEEEAYVPRAARGSSSLLFPALQSLHASSCRLLMGPLTGLEALPQLQHVYVDHCGITSLSEVATSLHSRVVL
ncbi:hypothetical protein ABL78_3532 [Leptomonas seymouri]|uniref:Leucine-rich repeat protein n=1 Tax=Leptomonas seymouri TaxID=5684 RepID=A0A0N1PDN7_LEPSE|nr:hypothetical protein ABL78_3532 [Leptomonas seymouri]|eukprot:KPI87398.1 hypothetical protein ABL78_3532 [Leptomonas seymouri]